MAENEAEKLKVQQEIAKARARSRVFEESAIDGRGLKIEQYSTEAPLIIGKSRHAERTWDINQSRHGERIWDIAQSRHGERYGIFINQGKKGTQLLWRTKKLTEQWQQNKQILPVCSAVC